MNQNKTQPKPRKLQREKILVYDVFVAQKTRSSNESFLVAIVDGRFTIIAPYSSDFDAATWIPTHMHTQAAEVELICGSGRWMIPGLIDIQVNDFEWLAQGLKSVDENQDRILQLLAHQRKHGVTSVMVATLASPENELLSYLQGIKKAHDRDPGIIGALVEGTFMNPKCLGAHNKDYVFPPNDEHTELLEAILETGAARAINIAAEMSTPDQAAKIIKMVTDKQVQVCTGHAMPNSDQLRQAAQAGVEYIIHFGNGNTTWSGKAFNHGGYMEECLRNDRLTLTVIVDLIHVQGAYIRDWLQRKEIQRMVAISDSAFGLGPPTSGNFEVFGIKGKVSEGGRYLETFGDSGRGIPTLFGASVFQDTCFKNLVNILSQETEGIYYRQHGACQLEDAISQSSQMCCQNPATLVKVKNRGSIQPSYLADFILAKVTGSQGHYEIDFEAVFFTEYRE